MAARSYNINLVNRTGSSLRRLAHGLCHGEWITEPPEEILPDQVGQWGSQSGGDIPLIGSIGTGTEGWVRYKASIPRSPATLGGIAQENVTEVLTIIWNNPFLGDTQVSWAPRRVPVPCGDKPVGASTFETVGDGTGLLEMYLADTPEVSEIEVPSFSTLANIYVALPLLIYNEGKNKPYAYTTLGARKASQQQQALEPEFAPQRAIKRVVAVRGAALASWVADWVGRSAEGADIVKVRVRIHDASRLAVHVDDLSGHKPATFDVIEAPVGGLTFPHVDVVTVPAMSGMAVHHDPHEQLQMQYHPNDPKDVARARNLENTMIRRSTSTVADRIFLSDVAAIEIYGAYEDGARSPAKWKLRYARWNSKGKTVIDLLCDGVPPIK